LIAQKFEKPEYFWPRPSAVDYNPLPSGGSNLGPTAAALKDAMAARNTKWNEQNPGVDMPNVLLFASGSGLDPHISPAAASAQVTRIAKARGLDETVLRTLVTDNTHGRDGGLLGEVTVNVLALNLALDKINAH
jgi:K+-transporting ATPase ATPase C chain